jgi:hypothetical protein
MDIMILVLRTEPRVDGIPTHTEYRVFPSPSVINHVRKSLSKRETYLYLVQDCMILE